ncbi:MAG: hypothetical protein QXD03_02425 [Candidatus Anstonellales archaeon]
MNVSKAVKIYINSLINKGKPIKMKYFRNRMRYDEYKEFRGLINYSLELIQDDMLSACK